MSPTFRRGHEAIEDSIKNSGKGGFTPWIPQFTWKDKDEKFLLVISPIEHCPLVDLFEWIEVGEKKKANGDTYTNFEQFISRKDKGIGEDYEKLEELGREPRERTLGVAVELEPVFETVRGRKRPRGFTVKTDQFTRKTDDGEVDIEAPQVGMLVQAQKNFFGWLTSFDRTTAPVTETPLQVVRRGGDSDTTYDFIPFEQEVDLSGLFENLDGIGYLSDEDREELNDRIEASEDDWTAAAEVGTFILDKRLDELSDQDRYDELVGPLESLPAPKFGGNKKKKDEDKPKRSSRPARRSPRPSSNGDGDHDDAPEETDEAGDNSGDDTNVKARFADLRKTVEG